MNSKNYYGSINLTKLINAAKALHPSIFKSEKTGDIYVNVNLFISEQKDKFKNNGAICTSQSEKDKEKGFYFGNFKENEKNKVSKEDVNNIDEDMPY